jgi:isocitrate dehydrogenase (NAD+)
MGVALKGPLTTLPSFESPNVALRKALGLFANLRPTKTYKGVPSKYEDVDLVIVRENTEDLYAGIEHKIGDYAGETIKLITRPCCERIMRFAFNYACENDRHKITAVHKATSLKFSDGLFLEVAKQIAMEYPSIKFEDRLVDNMCAQLVLKPQIYDVLVMPNFYGDIISDLCAGLVGGVGMAPGANLGKGVALFEAVHGSASKYAGKNRVNPTAMILAAAMMLRYLEKDELSDRIEKAVAAVLVERKTVTVDLGGTAGTKEMAKAIADKICFM